MSVALLVVGGVRGDPGSAVGVGDGTSEAGERVKRRAPSVISRQCRGPRRWISRTTAGGTRPSIGRPSRQAVPQVGRRDVEARDGHPLDPPAGSGRLGVHVAGPLDDHDRGEVAGLVEPAPGGHVGDRVGAEHEEQLAVRARDSASSVSAVTDASPRSISIADASTPSMPSTAAVDERERSAARRHDATALLPRVAGDDEQHAVEAELRRASRPRRPRARRARDRTCRRTRRAAPPSSAGVYGRVVSFTAAKHSRHLPP